MSEAALELLPDPEPLRYLAADGSPIDIPEDRFGLTDDDLVGLYRDMVRTRRFDTLAIALQRQGQLGVWASCRGQEAAQVGVAWAMGLRDWAFPSYREHGIAIVRGVPFVDQLGQYRGTWLNHYDPHEHRIAPHSIPIATQLLHAVGFAKAAALAGDDIVTVAFVGDGGTSEGDFHEAVNFAAVWQTPTVFVVQNNEYAISVPTAAQTRAPSIAHKGIGYGVPGFRVDGNDVLASFVTARRAIEHARAGGGPSLIEAHTYRMQPHTTADDDTRYRSETEHDLWRGRDPIARMAAWLLATGVADDDLVASIDAEADAEALEYRAAAIALEPPPPTALFEHVFVDPPASLLEQRDSLAEEAP